MPSKVPTAWSRQELGQIAVDSKSRFDPALESTVLPYVGLEHIVPGAAVVRDFGTSADVTSQKTVFRANDILFGKLRPYLRKVASVDREGVCSTDILAIRPLTGTDAGFLLALLSRAETIQWASHSSAGTKMPRTSWKALGELSVLVPPLPEQKKIAAILSSVDEAIQATQAVIEQTRRVKEGLLQDLLTRGIGHTRFKQTEIGEIPESWELVRLDAVSEVRSGMAKNSNKPHSDPIEVAYLRVANVQDGYLDLSEVKTIRIERSHLTRYALKAGDVLMNEGGDIDKLGRGDVWQGQIEPCVHQNHVFSVRCGEQLRPRFLQSVAESPLGKSYFLAKGKQTTNLASINKGQLRALPVPLPNLEEQDRIVARMHGVRASTERGQAARDRLVTLKAGLLQDLLSGKVRVSV